MRPKVIATMVAGGMLWLGSSSALAQSPSLQSGPSPDLRWTAVESIPEATPPSSPTVYQSGVLGIRPAPVAPMPEERQDTVYVKSGRGPALPLLLVGAAGVITGLIVGNDLITVVGAGLAGIGIYLGVR